MGQRLWWTMLPQQKNLLYKQNLIHTLWEKTEERTNWEKNTQSEVTKKSDIPNCSWHLCNEKYWTNHWRSWLQHVLSLWQLWQANVRAARNRPGSAASSSGSFWQKALTCLPTWCESLQHDRPTCAGRIGPKWPEAHIVVLLLHNS